MENTIFKKLYVVKDDRVNDVLESDSDVYIVIVNVSHIVSIQSWTYKYDDFRKIVEEEGSIVTLVNGETYYCTNDVDNFFE